MGSSNAADGGGGLSRRAFLGAAGVAIMSGGLAAVGLDVQRAFAAEPGDYSAPSLEFGDHAMQSRLGGPYQAALTDLSEINTVYADPAVYNRSGLVSYPPGTFVRAGGGYPEPQRWTRDCAVNAWNAASLLGPVAGRNTLWAVVNRQADGGLIVQQDNQWWDQIVWVSAAWHHYLVTGDQAFLPDAYETAVNTLAARKAANFNEKFGLFEGPGYMNDGIAGYPSPPWEPSIKSSFVLDYPGADRLMCLSTNCLYHGAYSALADMADALGRHAEASEHRSAGNRLRADINRHLWRQDAGLYGYFIHGDGALRDQLDTHQEGAGLAFAVMLGVADPARARRVLDNTHWQPCGIVNVWPHFERFDEQHPGRHEVVVWPNVHAFFGHAAAIGGRTDLFARAVTNLADLVTATNGNFWEIYNSVTGAVDGGWQTNSRGQIVHWGSQPNQAWSATGYLRMIYAGLFGLRFTPDSLQLAPTLPPHWGPVTLRGLPYREMTLDITLIGAGNRIKSFTLDDRRGPRVIPADRSGHHSVVIELDGSDQD